MNNPYFKTFLALVLFVTLISCSNTIKVAAMECEDLPSPQERSKCREEKQKGKDFHVKEARKNLMRGDKFASLDQLDQAIAQDPTAAKIVYDKGLVLFSVGKNNQALETLDKAIKLDPKLAKAHYFKAMAHTELHEYNEAIEAYKKTIEAKPEMAEAYYQMAKLLLDAQRRDEANKAMLTAYKIWKARKDKDPSFFLQQPKLQKKFFQARRYLRELGLIDKKNYKISPTNSPKKTDHDIKLDALSKALEAQENSDQ